MTEKPAMSRRGRREAGNAKELRPKAKAVQQSISVRRLNRSP
jgi:hypothetical protein